jgi:serine/threonine-protein kinase
MGNIGAGNLLPGGYRIVHELEGGGCAEIFAAEDARGQPVAVKVLRSEHAENDNVRVRFVREARVSNTIQHPDVVPVIADGVLPGGRPFLVMELLEGENIAARLARKGGRLPAKEVMWIGDRCLSVLASAHKMGVIHRDVKPDNLFLTRRRELKLLDFGIARLAESDSTGLTVMGVLMGSPGYMPPEQASGDWSKVGVRTDLWAVGACMFTLISGRLVHEEHDVMAQLRAAASHPPPSLADVAPDAPRPVVELVDFALRLDASARWPTARLMQIALRMAYTAMMRGVENGDEEIPEAPEHTSVNASAPSAPPPSLLDPRLVQANAATIIDGRRRE